jgi:hypothetical protein
VAIENGVELKRDRARMSWVPEKVPLKMEEEPELRFTSESVEAWPMGTIETAQAMDELGLALEVPKRAALAALKEVGKGRRHTVIIAAIRYRKHKADGWYRTPGTTPGTTLAPVPGEPASEPNVKTPEPRAGTTPGTGGNQGASQGGLGVPPHRGEPGPRPFPEQFEEEFPF